MFMRTSSSQAVRLRIMRRLHFTGPVVCIDPAPPGSPAGQGAAGRGSAPTAARLKDSNTPSAKPSTVAHDGKRPYRGLAGNLTVIDYSAFCLVQMIGCGLAGLMLLMAWGAWRRAPGK